MSNYPDDEGRDYVAEQAELQSEYELSIWRCTCGKLVQTKIPCVCTCGKIYTFWTPFREPTTRLEKMDLGHLNNTVRLLAKRAESLPPELRGPLETALDIIYAEIGSRDKEIAQVSGIMAALERSLK